ncbi:hypothetical protein B0H16DRAFT_52455 [Mycena metata]|uniref:Uncharacterized protein n=1 Tax=Mycena metata TaxID=1033252 RepID=A0AAD7IFU4_9AGAR|nr:hypothetical protein B0H16DRAFT_52455 [Mycena metata]
MRTAGRDAPSLFLLCLFISASGSYAPVCRCARDDFAHFSFAWGARRIPLLSEGQASKLQPSCWLSPRPSAPFLFLASPSRFHSYADICASHSPQVCIRRPRLVSVRITFTSLFLVSIRLINDTGLPDFTPTTRPPYTRSALPGRIILVLSGRRRTCKPFLLPSYALDAPVLHAHVPPAHLPRRRTSSLLLLPPPPRARLHPRTPPRAPRADRPPTSTSHPPHTLLDGSTPAAHSLLPPYNVKCGGVVFAVYAGMGVGKAGDSRVFALAEVSGLRQWARIRGRGKNRAGSTGAKV